jgi:hypothetical protein
MAYIGQSIKNGTFTTLDTSGNTYNGSNTAFALGTQVGSPAQLLVSHDGVIQKPGTDYTLSSGGTAITFTTAPASGASIFIVEISGAVGGPMNTDINGAEFILDVDGDTSIRADADDIIRFKAGANDALQILQTRSEFLVAALSPETILTDEATISWNAQTQQVCKVTLAGNRTLAAPSNPINGQFVSLLVIQDGTGSRVLTWNAVYEFTADTAPTLTTTANLGDLFVFRYSGAKWLEVGRNLNLVLS